MRLVRWDPENPLSDELRDGMLRAARVLHADPDDPSFGALAAMGIAVTTAPNIIEDGAEFLVIPTGSGWNESESGNRGEALERVVSIVDRLLGPGGCPWDQEQTHESLKRHLVEEAYEVLDAIDSGSKSKLAEELGDLLLQPIMHAQMAALDGEFDIAEVATGIANKLVRRHPHVFGPLDASDSEEVLRNWDLIKRAEKGSPGTSALDGVPSGSASLIRAFEISRKAARAGFEWPDLAAVLAKLHEEETELLEALESGHSKRIEEEVGDLLFTAVNVARWVGVEPETALRSMVNRFIARFQAMESASSKPLGELSPQEWDELWEATKRTSTP